MQKPHVFLHLRTIFFLPHFPLANLRWHLDGFFWSKHKDGGTAPPPAPIGAHKTASLLQTPLEGTGVQVPSEILTQLVPLTMSAPFSGRVQM